MGPYSFADTLSKYKMDFNSGEQESNQNSKQTIGKFQGEVTKKINPGLPTFSNTQQKVAPLDLDQYKDEEDKEERDTRTLNEKQKDFREGKNSNNNFVTGLLDNYLNTKDDTKGNALDNLNLTDDIKEEAFNIFKDPSKESGPTFENLEKLNQGKYFDQAGNIIENASEIKPGADYAFGGANDVSDYYSTVDGVTKGSEGASKGWQGTGSTAGSIMSVASFASQIANAYAVDKETEGENFAEGASLIVSGAAAGLSVAGPWGALVGAVVGTGVAVSDYIGDQSQRKKKGIRRRDDRLSEDKRRRARDYGLSKSKKRNDALAAFHQAQLGYINLDNY